MLYGSKPRYPDLQDAFSQILLIFSIETREPENFLEDVAGTCTCSQTRNQYTREAQMNATKIWGVLKG